VLTPYPTVRISRKGADRVASGHPWVFASDVEDRGEATAGAVVRVADARGRAHGVAHYSDASQITLRLLSPDPVTIDGEFFRRRIVAAQAHRARVVENSNAYRLVHAEADRLPGLIVDRYDDAFVMQTLDQGMDRERDTIAGCLEDLFAPRSIVLRNDAPVRAKEALPLESRLLHGSLDGAVSVRMNGLEWRADLLHGQKTGVFLDQRENYLAASRHARGDALDCFTSTGGFALHLAARCATVEGVDSAAEALATAEANRAANHIENVRFREANAFDLLAGYAAAGRKFSTVVLDPPAFAKSRGALDGAVRGYKEINLRALKLLSPGGILVTCSCSFHMSEALLLQTVAEAALDAHRTLRVLERRTQSADHPILLTVPETHYLKCLILELL
jgi:23S rRNA (cytosine1962-C5)-methyltransferase